MSRAPTLLILAVMISSCTARGPASTPAASPPDTTVRFVAIGASETAGLGAREPLRDAWPTVLWRRKLPKGTVYYNLGIPGATVNDALRYEIDSALSTHPTIATVWLNVNDLLSDVPTRTFQRRLNLLLSNLQESGAAIFVANTPQLAALPAFTECRVDPRHPNCPPGGAPSRRHLAELVRSYNRAIIEVARESDASVVDLFALGNIPRDHPEWISRDGFHPSSRGHAAIADAFARALRLAGAI